MKTKKNNKVIAISFMLMTSLLQCNVLAQATIQERKAKATKVAALYNMAEKAYRDGDIDVARETLAIVLAEQPGHPHAIALRRRIQLNGNQLELAKKKRIFSAVFIKEVNLKGVSLAQALKILNQQVMIASGKKVIPNFVLTDPKKILGKERLELEMKNVPAGVVLDHLMKKAGTTASFGKYSITVRPRESSHTKKATQESTIEPKKEEEDGF